MPLKPKEQGKPPATQGSGPLLPYWVTAVGGLRIRAQPSANSEVLGLIEQGTEIELEDMAGLQEETINGRKGHWRAYKGGWIFDGYVEPATRVFYTRRAAIPVYSSPAVGSPVRKLPAGTPIVVSQYSISATFDPVHKAQTNSEWIGFLSSTNDCDRSQAEIAWVNRSDLRPAVPRWPFCSDNVKRNCLDPALKKFVIAGYINDNQDCVYVSGIRLFPEGDVTSCPGKIGSWTLQADGSIVISLHTRFYRSSMGPADPGVMFNRPSLIYIRKVNVNDLRFPADVPHAWPQWRENIRKGDFGGEDSGFLPVTPGNKPFAVFAYEC